MSRFVSATVRGCMVILVLDSLIPWTYLTPWNDGSVEAPSKAPTAFPRLKGPSRDAKIGFGQAAIE